MRTLICWVMIWHSLTDGHATFSRSQFNCFYQNTKVHFEMKGVYRKRGGGGGGGGGGGQGGHRPPPPPPPPPPPTQFFGLGGTGGTKKWYQHLQVSVPMKLVVVLNGFTFFIHDSHSYRRREVGDTGKGSGDGVRYVDSLTGEIT